MMHVGVVSLTDPDYGFDMAHALGGEDVTVSLYQSRKHIAPMVKDPERSIVDQVYEQGLLDPAIKLYLTKWPRMRDPRTILAANRLSHQMRDQGIDVAHVLAGSGELWLVFLALILRWMRKVPVVATMIVPRPNPGEYPPRWVQSISNRVLTYGGDIIIANGQTDAELVHELYGVSERRISYVPLNPRVSAARWATASVPEEPGTILFLGRMRRYKGLDYLIKAQPLITARMPHARFVIAGSGSEELERCRAMIEDESYFEIFDGFVPNEQAATYFQRASLVALPYTSAATSGILLTAYVYGKPVVVSNVGSLPEYVEDGQTGLLVPPADVEQLADAIVQLLTDDDRRHQMGVNAKQWIADEQRRIARMSIEVYKQAIALRGQRSH